jgi:hypothetical protein
MNMGDMPRLTKKLLYTVLIVAVVGSVVGSTAATLLVMYLFKGGS